MTKLPAVTWSAIVLITVSSFSPAIAQESKANKIDEKTFGALVAKYKNWKVDSAWGRVKKEDQEGYNFSPLATISFSSNKFEAIDTKGIRTKGTWSRSSQEDSLPFISFLPKKGHWWFLSDYEISGAKRYLILEQDVCNDACRVWYRLRPK